MASDGDGPRRYLIATAVAQYPPEPSWDRPGLVEARERIITLFTEHLGYQHVTGLGLNPTKAQLTRRAWRGRCFDELLLSPAGVECCQQCSSHADEERAKGRPESRHEKVSA